jgi:hypothetical protein
MKEFNVYGYITLKVDLDVAAKSEIKALEVAAMKLKDQYNLDVIGYSHDPDTIQWDLNAVEYVD